MFTTKRFWRNKLRFLENDSISRVSLGRGRFKRKSNPTHKASEKRRAKSLRKHRMFPNVKREVK